MAQTCTFYRGEIVLNIKTLEVASVTCDPLAGLPRKLVPVSVNTFGGEKPYQIQWRSQDCLSLGFGWAGAWLRLRQMRDTEGWTGLTDPRLGLPEVEYAS